MTHNFITNQGDNKTLKARLRELIEHSAELKFLSGFFYFSGIQPLYEALKKNEEVVLKVLVGLNVDKYLGKIVEIDKTQPNENYDDSDKDRAEQFFQSLNSAFNDEIMDNETFYQQIYFFLEMMKKNRLILRKTKNPNHAKLYIFKVKEHLRGIADAKFITGSSNLTRSGIEQQDEFNVEIGDYGTDHAETYFDELWEDATEITEKDECKQRLVDFFEKKSLAAAVTPFEAYALTLKTYLDVEEEKKLPPKLGHLLENKGYRNSTYQTDAVYQALDKIEKHNGAILADVVGLGKSVIASMTANLLNKRGMILCPPGLVGDENATFGWRKYKRDFELHGWDVRSSGNLESAAEYVSEQGKDIEVIIIDEAHRFRNQDTANYEFLSRICRNRIVLLLTATPFNNSPADILSLLKLFLIPGQSSITLFNNLEYAFAEYERRFKKLSFILKNYQSSDEKKRADAETRYRTMFKEEPPVNVSTVKLASKKLASEIRGVLVPVLIRRNRLDLMKNKRYEGEVKNLSTIRDPEELFFELTQEQSQFYDRVIKEYFAEKGEFKGAIYQPFNYENHKFDFNPDDLDDLDKKGDHRESLQQHNLYGFMRRLLVKRFESSFGSFERSIETFERVHQSIVLFMENSNERYILDRTLIEKIYEDDEDAINEHLKEYGKELNKAIQPKNQNIYKVNKSFIKDVESDLRLLRKIKEEVRELALADDDPKARRLVEMLKKSLHDDPDRKIIIFTEYVDTVKHLFMLLEPHFNGQILTIAGTLGAGDLKNLNANFDAGYPESVQENQFNILLASDKISEGFNLNRAGTIINYDIPWNPTRVIQRVGRINRIGQKVFDKLYLFNFFPTIQGSDVIRSREIASQKMFLIHNTLGEDAKIFAADEIPSASELHSRQTQFSEDEEESQFTIVQNLYEEIVAKHPEVIKNIKDLPPRVKTAKKFDSYELVVLRRKGAALFAQKVLNVKGEPEIKNILFEDMIVSATCDYQEERLNVSCDFWKNYENIKAYEQDASSGPPENSLERRALNGLESALRFHSNEMPNEEAFINTLMDDLRKYLTLPSYTLRRLTKYNLDKKATGADVHGFVEQIQKIKHYFGEDYLDIIKERVKKHKKEIIIAVENIK